LFLQPSFWNGSRLASFASQILYLLSSFSRRMSFSLLSTSCNVSLCELGFGSKKAMMLSSLWTDGFHCGEWQIQRESHLLHQWQSLKGKASGLYNRQREKKLVSMVCLGFVYSGFGYFALCWFQAKQKKILIALAFYHTLLPDATTWCVVHFGWACGMELKLPDVTTRACGQKLVQNVRSTTWLFHMLVCVRPCKNTELFKGMSPISMCFKYRY
jgi:hypothetical protein